MNESELSEMIIGESAATREMRSLIVTLAVSESPVLIRGETGSGKELVAMALHSLSGRHGAFVPINVTAIPEGTFESMVFGHVRGAFTNAIADKRGYLTEADNGTVFFDEIADMPPPSQPKLLRAIEQRSYRPVGAAKDRGSNFRLVSATSRNLLALVDDGLFRPDLAERLRTFIIDVPALARRRSDIPALAEHFAARFAEYDGTPPIRFMNDAIDALGQYHWPRNIRELKNVVERMHVLNRHRSVHASEVARALDERPALPRGPAIDQRKRDELVAVLEREGWDTVKVALVLGVDRSTVYRQMHRLGIAWRRT